MRLITLMMIIALLLLLNVQVAGALELRFWPQSQIIAPSETGTLSVYVDEALDLRTIELRISYDPTILLSLEGGPGQLFDDTGCLIWWGFEEPEPGDWHGFAVVIDAYCWVTGPGELFYWDFSGIQEGLSRIVVDELLLYDVAGEPMDGVSLSDTWVFVSETGTSVPGDDSENLSWSNLRSLY